MAVLPVAPAPEPGRLCQESPVCQQGVQVETGTGLGTFLMHTSCRGQEGTWGARECSQPGPQRGAGLPRAFVASPGDCTSFSEWTVLGTGPDALVTGEGPRTYSVLFGGEGHSTGCPGVIQRAAAALPIGTGYKASLCGSRQGRAWESLRGTSLSPHPNLGPGTLPV